MNDLRHHTNAQMLYRETGWARSARRAMGISVLLVSSAFLLPAPTGKGRPFAGLDERVKTGWGGWDGNQQVLATEFGNERRRLGDAFEPALLKYLGDVTSKHYAAGLWLHDKDYLHGFEPDPHLALLVFEQGAAICRDKSGEEPNAQLVGISVFAALLSERIGLSHLAAAHKREAQALILRDANLAGAFPCLRDEDRRIYDSIRLRR